jgi:hypothetical protein
MSSYAIQINIVLATLVVSIGAWLVWGPFPIVWSLALAGGIFLFLLWRGETIGMVWAWATFLLGSESLAWPITIMVQLHSSSGQPSDEEMGVILNAVLFGLFSSVFWISFAFGLYKREQRAAEPALREDHSPPVNEKARSRRKTRRS